MRERHASPPSGTALAGRTAGRRAGRGSVDPAEPGVEIGNVLHRLLAVRVNPNHLRVDFRPDLGKAVYADYPLELMLDELTFFDDIDRSAVVRLESGSYILWMVPAGGTLTARS